MPKISDCPSCGSIYSYEEGFFFICSECAYEWTKDTTKTDNEEKTVTDLNGNILNDGDTVIVIKDLKVKGSSNPIKKGTKVKSIKLVEGDHDIECKIHGFGAMSLKSEFVKKAEK